MNINYKRWQLLFLFCLGLFAGTAFCMKWMEGDFLVHGKKFTIIGLEILYNRREMVNVFTGMDDPVRSILRYHCYFDFVFMLGVYPGIAAFCMMARLRTTSRSLQQGLAFFAALQVIAWIADIVENCFLLRWINHPEIGSQLLLFNSISLLKWILALAAVLLATFTFLKRKKCL